MRMYGIPFIMSLSDSHEKRLLLFATSGQPELHLLLTDLSGEVLAVTNQTPEIS